MPVAMIQEFAIQDRSTTNYDAISERLRGGPPAEGLLAHTAGFDDEAGVFRIFDVWESKEQADAFQARVMELVGDLAPPDAPGPTRQALYELHGSPLASPRSCLPRTRVRTRLGRLRPTLNVHLQRARKRTHGVRDGEGGGYEREDDRSALRRSPRHGPRVAASDSTLQVDLQRLAARPVLCHRPGRPELETARRTEATMHAVVARSTIEDFDQARKALRDELIPRLKQAPGFVSGHWVRLGETSGASMIVFESEESAQAAAEMFRNNPPATVKPTSVEVGEVQEHA